MGAKGKGVNPLSMSQPIERGLLFKLQRGDSEPVAAADQLPLAPDASEGAPSSIEVALPTPTSSCKAKTPPSGIKKLWHSVTGRTPKSSSTKSKSRLGEEASDVSSADASGQVTPVKRTSVDDTGVVDQSPAVMSAHQQHSPFAALSTRALSNRHSGEEEDSSGLTCATTPTASSRQYSCAPPAAAEDSFQEAGSNASFSPVSVYAGSMRCEAVPTNLVSALMAEGEATSGSACPNTPSPCPAADGAGASAAGSTAGSAAAGSPASAVGSLADLQEQPTDSPQRPSPAAGTESGHASSASTPAAKATEDVDTAAAASPQQEPSPATAEGPAAEAAAAVPAEEVSPAAIEVPLAAEGVLEATEGV